MSNSDLTRREFLRRGAGVFAAAACGGPVLLGGCPSESTLQTAAVARPVADRATVSAIKGDNLYQMTRDAIDAIGGMSSIVRPGETVFIKPNLLTAGLARDNHVLTGEIAKPEVAIAAAEECLKAGASQVTIGDGAQVVRFSWEELRTLDGGSNFAAEVERLNATYDANVTLACLNDDSPEWDPVPSRRTYLNQIYLSSLVTRADRVISIPVLKTHKYTQVSLSIKNLMGTSPIARYGGGTEDRGRAVLHQTFAGVAAAFLDMFEAVRPDLAIIDASICAEGYAPWVRPNAGRTVDMRDRLGDWLVLASTDPVAADATAARVIGKDYVDVDHLRLAYEQGLGQARADMVRLEGAALDELFVEWEPAIR